MDPPLLQARGLPAGSRTVLLGDNGAGQSTLLRLLQGALTPDGGWVRLEGRPLRGQRRRVALLPQSAPLAWHYPIDVLGLVALGADGDRRRGLTALQQVGLEALAHRAIGQLSGGQRQGALIARALAQGATCLQRILRRAALVGLVVSTGSCSLALLFDLPPGPLMACACLPLLLGGRKGAGEGSGEGL